MPLKLTRRHGSPNWYIRGTIRGVAVDETTGVSDKAAAEALRARREWEIVQGSVFGRKAAATFLEAAVGYLEAGGEARFVRRITDHFTGKTLAEIDQTAIDHAARQLYPKAAPATLDRQLYAPISAILNHAASRGLCEARKIARPTLPKGRVRWLTPEEADRLIEACSPHLRPLVIFLFYTGARMSEALYLDWREVNLQNAQVQFIDTKNGDARGVPLHPRVVAELASMSHRIDEVFRRPDGFAYERKESSGGQIKTAFRGACRRAGINDFSPHDCRHTWATWHYAANRDLIGLMKLGGWKSEKMVLRYAHVNVQHLAQSIEALPWQHRTYGA
ncbi:MAG: site-specific integrase [Bradyrhizobiaceae bacterium]|nr:MAG: site-specific integrase [Bradyrhizobiaceae bacterium]